jgi:hypothetical protein
MQITAKSKTGKGEEAKEGRRGKSIAFSFSTLWHFF